jgi:hypothetical protein
MDYPGVPSIGDYQRSMLRKALGVAEGAAESGESKYTDDIIEALTESGVDSATKSSRSFAERLADFEKNQSNWSLESLHAEKAVSRRASGGASEQMIYRNAQTGETIVRHRLTTPNGKVLEDHFRPTYKPRVGRGGNDAEVD